MRKTCYLLWSGQLIRFCCRARDATRYQFIVDLLDIWVPATNLGLVNINDGFIGIFGYVSRDQVVFSSLTAPQCYFISDDFASAVDCGRLRKEVKRVLPLYWF